MKYLLIPSRHIIYTNEQYDALDSYLAENSYDCIVFAITSFNLNNCKYSPVDIIHRVLMINSLIYSLRQKYNFKYKIICIPHFSNTKDYAGTLVKYVNYNLSINIDSGSTDVFVFGNFIGSEFENSGYKTFKAIYKDHVNLFQELFVNKNQKYFDQHISIASKSVLDNQDDILEKAEKIWTDPVLKEMGSITETRNYHTYAYDMSNDLIIKIKYDDIKPYIREGKIVDEGCADAALFIPMAKDFLDSDLIGIDISNDFIARANERIREGYFGNSFVNIVQANLLNRLFEDNFVNTVICNSTLHEIWSYNNKLQSIKDYLKLKYNQLVPGGRIIARDVIGPNEPDKTVFLRDNENDNELFKKFINDFGHVRPKDTFEDVLIDGKNYVKTNLKIVSEYLLHKDYADNWQSEMNEEFCHFGTNDWSSILLESGFKVVAINQYQSQWIVENRLVGKIDLLDENKKPVEYPHTNVIIVAEK